MGKQAELKITGKECSLCGIYFVKPHGYPVVCKDCWEDLSVKERKDYQLATKKEL